MFMLIPPEGFRYVNTSRTYASFWDFRRWWDRLARIGCEHNGCGDRTELRNPVNSGLENHDLYDEAIGASDAVHFDDLRHRFEFGKAGTECRMRGIETDERRDLCAHKFGGNPRAIAGDDASLIEPLNARRHSWLR